MLSRAVPAPSELVVQLVTFRDEGRFRITAVTQLQEQQCTTEGCVAQGHALESPGREDILVPESSASFGPFNPVFWLLCK